jgi:hypothetical protein
MNSYDQKHLDLLLLVAAGNWRAIPDADAGELRVLAVCKYLTFGTDASGQPSVSLNTEGGHYLRHLCRLAALHMSQRAPACSEEFRSV